MFFLTILIPLVLAWLGWALALPPRPAAWILAVSGLPLLILGSWLGHRDTGVRWTEFVRRTVDMHALALVLLAALAVQFEDAHGVTTDGVIYFTQLRSLLFDGDLNVAAEFAYLGQPPRPSHVVPIGPTLVWVPLYLAVATIDAAGRASGLVAQPAAAIAVGLTEPYVRAALVSSFLIGALGLVVVHRRLRQEFGAGLALMTTLLLFGASPLIWYMVYEPSMTHAASFGFVAIFVVASERWTSVVMSPRRSVLLGALLGLAVITRPQESLFAIFPAVLLLAAPASLGERLRAAARLGAYAFAGVLGFLVLQAAHSTILLNREEFALVGSGGYLDLVHSRWADTLWSSWHGFLSWTPVAYIALVGTAFYVRRRWPWATAALVIVAMMAWVNGSTADWAAGWSFGGRRFISVLVVLAPGLAFVLQQLGRRPLIAIAVVAALTIGWNQLLRVQYATGMLARNSAVSFGQIVRQQASLATEPPFIYPFAFPANVWFAWRSGLPVDRYDLLGPEPLRPSIDLPMNATAGKFLMDGWGVRGGDTFGDLRWIDGTRAEIVLPLGLGTAHEVTAIINARTREVDPPGDVIVTVRVNGRELGTLVPSADRPSEHMFRTVGAAGVWKAGFNRVLLEKPPGTAPIAIYRIRIN